MTIFGNDAKVLPILGFPKLSIRWYLLCCHGNSNEGIGKTWRQHESPLNLCEGAISTHLSVSTEVITIISVRVYAYTQMAIGSNPGISSSRKSGRWAGKVPGWHFSETNRDGLLLIGKRQLYMFIYVNGVIATFNTFSYYFQMHTSPEVAQNIILKHWKTISKQI